MMKEIHLMKISIVVEKIKVNWKWLVRHKSTFSYLPTVGNSFTYSCKTLKLFLKVVLIYWVVIK